MAGDDQAFGRNAAARALLDLLVLRLMRRSRLIEEG